MKNIKRITAISILFVLFSFCNLEAGLKLVDNGTSKYKIALNPGHSPSEKHAAVELQNHIEQSTSAKIEIIESPTANDTQLIILGRGSLSQKFAVNPTNEQLGPQGAAIKTVAQNLIIAGTKQAGTLNGVYRFLEEYVGVRWLAPNVTKVPKRTKLEIPEIERIFKPAFLYRQTSYYNADYGDSNFKARKGFNYGTGGPESKFGNRYQFKGKCHSYYAFISPKEYFEKHPEYFSMMNGKRIKHEAQLCLTNPDVFEIVSEKMLKLIETKPQFSQFNFSQMDYYNYCQCDECKKINEKYQTNGATQFWFVNKLAQRISEKFPDKLIGTLAYTYTEKPPVGMKMHPNAAVWLCHMFPCCDSHPIKTCPKNKTYKERVEKWSKICTHLYIWHYITNFAHYYNPFPNFRAIAADLKFYRDNGVEGIYLQGMGQRGGGGEFYRLRPYYAMKLAWDPDQNPEAIINEFLQDYYGRAAAPIQTYINMLHDIVEKQNIHMHLYTNPAQGYLPDEVIVKSNKLFDQAEMLVKDDPVLLERVKIARMPVVYASLFPRNGYRIENGMLKLSGKIVSYPKLVEFDKQMQKHGFINFREFYGKRDILLPITQFIYLPKKIETIENEHLKLQIVPMLAGRILKIIDKKTGKCITSHNNVRSLYFPLCGGFENRVGESFYSWGWCEPGLLVDRSNNSLTVQIKTTGGDQITRTVTLGKNAPQINIKTELKNTSKKARPSRLQSHLELDIASFGGDVKYEFTTPQKKIVQHDIANNVIPTLREGKYYSDINIPDGKWTFTGKNGLKLTHEFDLKQTHFTWLVCYPQENNDLEINVWLNNVTLQPGQSITTNNRLILNSK